MKKFTVLAVVLLLAIGLAAVSGLSAQQGAARLAIVENQTGDGITLSYAETVGGSASKSQVPLRQGQTIQLDPAKLQGEVCAWKMPPLKVAEKIGCRTLKAGDHWVIR